MGAAFDFMCLDLATRLGWAYRSAGGAVLHGIYALPSQTDVGHFLHRYDLWLSEMLDGMQPSAIWFEAPYVDANTHQETALKLLGLASHTRLVAFRRRINATPVNNSSVRKHFLGSKRGDRKTLKRLTIEACIAHGWNPKSDDDADALAIMDWVVHTRKLPGAATPMFRVPA